MDIFQKLFKSLLSYPKVALKISPNSFADIVKQLEQPSLKKEKTPLQIFQDYIYKESMSKLEVEMLKMEPDRCYKGFQIYYDNSGNKFFDWVPCVIRPEIVYCSYGKN